MGYVGNQTTNSYTSLDKQTITGNGGTSYTLDHAVANVNEIEVFVNNVRQEPSVAYTVSGTALTMTGNVAASDDFYVVFQGKAIQTVVPPSDSITTAMINNGAVTAAKVDSTLHLSTIKESTGTTTAMTIDSSGRINTPERPYIRLKGNNSNRVTDQGTTEVYTNFSVAENKGITWNSSNGRITVPIDGWYLITPQFYVWANNANQHWIQMRINGSITQEFTTEFDGVNGSQNDITVGHAALLNLSANDYIDFFCSADIYGGATHSVCQMVLVG